MVKRASIELIESSQPIRDPVTKFGGQPTWLMAPQWPISRQTGQQMRFIGQIALDPDLFGSVEGRMAYIFMTDCDDVVIDTWKPDGGENAVIVQPGDPLVPVQNLAEGPSLYRMSPRRGSRLLFPEPCEFAVRLTCGEDPDIFSDAALQEPGFDLGPYYEAIGGNKIAGTPLFLQQHQLPGDDYRSLLLQLDSTRVPFSINFGDCGVGLAFLCRDGRSGKFLWQCA